MKNEPGASYVGVCTAIVAGLLAIVAPSIAVAQTLPSGWTASNIGSPALAGSAVYSTNTFSVSGAGMSIWGNVDQFMFVHRQMIGDGTIVIRVKSLLGANGWSSAGIMVRESLAANSKNAAALVAATDGVGFQWRPSAGGATMSRFGGPAKAPIWLKLERQGSAFRAFQSSNGTTWTSLGSQTISMGTTLYAGLAVVSYLPNKRATATFDNVSVGGSQAPPPPPPPSPPPTSNKPPAVSLTTPVGGASFAVGSAITLAATASDSDGSVARVDFYRGSQLIASDTSNPYTVVWPNVAAGSYALTAVARDNIGAATTSAISTITVSSNRPPVVSLTAPAVGAQFTAPASIALSAGASDPDGTIARVDFYNGSTLIGSDASSPYTFSWSNVAAGTYSVTAVARDNGGATTVSGALGVLVVSVQLPKHAVFTPPANHATAVNRYLLEIFAAGSNPATASPIATLDMGKPSVVGGVCNVYIAPTVMSLPTGTYIATVTAIGSGGQAQSTASPPFTR